VRTPSLSRRRGSRMMTVRHCPTLSAFKLKRKLKELKVKVEIVSLIIRRRISNLLLLPRKNRNFHKFLPKKFRNFLLVLPRKNRSPQKILAILSKEIQRGNLLSLMTKTTLQTHRKPRLKRVLFLRSHPLLSLKSHPLLSRVKTLLYKLPVPPYHQKPLLSWMKRRERTNLKLHHLQMMKRSSEKPLSKNLLRRMSNCSKSFWMSAWC
jgi:hypothetical protein